MIELDLGGRILDCLATPGHHQAAVTFYDRYTGILFTGDTIGPFRLYVFDWPAFVRSIDRLVEFCAERPVTYLLGCHIEMTTTPGEDYPVGWTYQPDEPPLEVTTDHLKEIQTTLRAHDNEPGRYVLPQMIITPAPDNSESVWGTPYGARSATLSRVTSTGVSLDLTIPAEGCRSG